MHIQGYLEVYIDGNGFVAILSQPSLNGDDYGEVKINKDDVDRLKNALDEISEELKKK